jgi:hypothetical protein
MIVEYIRYKIDPSGTSEFDDAYRRAGCCSMPHRTVSAGRRPAASTSLRSRSSA